MYYFLIPVGMFYIFFWDFIFLKSLCWIFGKWDDTAQNLAKKGNHKRYSCICSNRTRYVNILINIHHSQDKLGTILPRLSILNFFSIFKKISLALYQINFILSHWTNGNYWSRAENCESFTGIVGAVYWCARNCRSWPGFQTSVPGTPSTSPVLQLPGTRLSPGAALDSLTSQKLWGAGLGIQSLAAGHTYHNQSIIKAVWYTFMNTQLPNISYQQKLNKKL